MPSIRRVLPLLGLAALGSQPVIAEDQCSCYEQMLSGLSNDAFNVMAKAGIPAHGLTTISEFLDYNELPEGVKDRGLETVRSAYTDVMKAIDPAMDYTEEDQASYHQRTRGAIYKALPVFLENSMKARAADWKVNKTMTDTEIMYAKELLGHTVNTVSQVVAADLIFDAKFATQIAAKLTKNKEDYVALKDHDKASFLMIWDVIDTIVDALTFDDFKNFSKEMIKALAGFEKKLAGDLNTLPFDPSVADENAWETNHKEKFKKTLHTIAKLAGNKDLLPFNFEDHTQVIMYAIDKVIKSTDDKDTDGYGALLKKLTDNSAFIAFKDSDAVKNFWGKDQTGATEVNKDAKEYYFFEALDKLVDDAAFKTFVEAILPTIKGTIKSKIGERKDGVAYVYGWVVSAQTKIGVYKADETSSVGKTRRRRQAEVVKQDGEEGNDVEENSECLCRTPYFATYVSGGSSAGVSAILVSLGAMAFFLLKD